LKQSGKGLGDAVLLINKKVVYNAERKKYPTRNTRPAGWTPKPPHSWHSRGKE